MGSTTEFGRLERLSSNLMAVARAAASQLTHVLETPEGTFIRTPLMYPGGASVVIQVMGGPGSYFVSDYGQGHLEAELIGASRQYAAVARNFSQDARIGFDGRCLFASDLKREQLPAAIAVVANCSMRAVGMASLKLVQRRYQESNEALYDRLVHLFGKGRVEKQPEILGASSHEWHVSALVKRQGRRTVFDLVKPAPASIYQHVTMFHDLARLDDAPARVAVVPAIAQLTPDDLGLLHQAAKVIEQDSPEQAYREAA